jgi:hypothetical protein
METKNAAKIKKARMYNCHTHIFTGDHAPLARVSRRVQLSARFQTRKGSVCNEL